MNIIDRLIGWYTSGRIKGAPWREAITSFVALQGTQAQVEKWAAILAAEVG